MPTRCVRKTLYSAEQRRLAALLKEIRNDAGLTQAELGARLGRPQSFVAKIEAGQRRLDLIELRTIAEALGTDLRTIVDRFEAN